jgi:PD-(D/E)XK nuclease superfamily protein
VLAALIKLGYPVAVPFGVARYDLVVEMDDGFKRIQCKTGRLRDGAVRFSAASLSSDRRPGYIKKNPYIGSADFFGVFCPDTDAVYLVPVGDQRTEVSLRVAPSANSQAKGVRWARDFELIRRESSTGVSLEVVQRIALTDAR